MRNNDLDRYVYAGKTVVWMKVYKNGDAVQMVLASSTPGGIELTAINETLRHPDCIEISGHVPFGTNAGHCGVERIYTPTTTFFVPITSSLFQVSCQDLPDIASWLLFKNIRSLWFLCRMRT